MRHIALVLVVIIVAVGVTGQQPPPSIKLNPEASRRFIELGVQSKQTYSQCKTLLDAQANEQRGILLGAGVPAEMRNNCQPDTAGIVICKKPETAKTKE